MKHENAVRLACALLSPLGDKSHEAIALEKRIGTIGFKELIDEIIESLPSTKGTMSIVKELNAMR